MLFIKKITILMIIIIGWLSNTYATHNRAGHINYKHLSGLTYEVSVTTYTKDSSPADRPGLRFFWGDGSNDSIPRSEKISLSNDINKNTYTSTHTYPCPNSYTISILDINRNSGIINIPNSVNVPLYLESELTILSDSEFNNSVSFSAPLIFQASVGEDFTYNLSAFDTDGDNLSFELITPKQGSNQNVIGYIQPDSISINSINGELVWAPLAIGEYVITIKITECRNGIKVGSVAADLQITVASGLSVNGEFQELTNWQIDSNNNYVTTIDPSDSIQLEIVYSRNSPSGSVNLEVYGEVLDSGNISSFFISSFASNLIRKVFKWKPKPENLRCSPYITTFRGFISSSTINFGYKDLTLLIYVRDSSLTNCDSICNSSIISIPHRIKPIITDALVYPNPFNSIARIILTNHENKQYSELTLYDIFGKEVQSIPIAPNATEVIISRNGLSSGTYIYRLKGNSDNSESGKLVITNEKI